jgi:DNA-binding MarR family transcriptional regulator
MSKQREQLLKELIKKLTRASRSIESTNCSTFGAKNITRPQADLLLYISSKESGVTAKEISEEFHVTPGAVTQFIDSLVDKKLVTRVESKNDRRIQYITLTASMRKYFADFEKSFIASVDDQLKNLSDQEIVQLTGLLSKINGKYTDCDLSKGGDSK